MRVVTKQPFGNGNHTEVVLEAGSRGVKNKWMFAFTDGLDPSGGKRDTEGQLLCEGPLLKIANSGTNKLRWFRLTNKNLAYYREESGEHMASVDLEHVLVVSTNGLFFSSRFVHRGERRKYKNKLEGAG